ncbi:UNVERIFIED_CONTAM: hypothetical protein Sindi_1842700, partial [Sesamum indicum]
AEYRSMVATVCELNGCPICSSILAFTCLFQFVFFATTKRPSIMANPVFHERMKHKEIDCHVVRTAYKDGFIAPLHIRSSLQLVNLFTKSLPLETFAFLLANLECSSFGDDGRHFCCKTSIGRCLGR